MAEETRTEESKDEVVELTLAQLDERIAAAATEKAKEVADAAKAEADELRLELARQREDNRVIEVREVIRGLQESGHSPAVLAKAAELMLADTSHEVVLELSQKVSEDSDEVVTRKLTATDIVVEMLAAIPETSLELNQPRVTRRTDPPTTEDKRTPAEKAEELLEELRETAVRLPI